MANHHTTTNTSTLHVGPTISATGNESVLINGGGNQPIIPATTNEITVNETVITSGTTYASLTETQIGGENITLNNGANLSIQGDALGIFYGNVDTITAAGGTITGLYGAQSTVASYDSHMEIIATGTADTLSIEAINENFGLISIGNGDTLTINNTYGNGANAQALHGLINYGLITVAAGGDLNITAAAASGGTYSNFYNAGWIIVDGGTLSISSSVLDGANTASTASGVDGYIEIGAGGNVILAGTVGKQEQVDFTDTAANTLQITAGTLFSGTVNNFGGGDTIIVNGFTSTSNATITTVGGVTELVTTNGSVLTTITLTGTIGSNITTTFANGQETITGGGSSLSSTTTYGGGTNTISSPTGTLFNTGTVTVTGAGTDLVVASSVTGTGGTFFIDNGATLALANPAGNDATQTIIFGTHGTTAALNTLLLNDNTLGFGGTITGFGTGDDIVLGGSVLPLSVTGEGEVLSYNSAASVLTVTETAANGSVVGTSTLHITGTSLSTANFVAVETTAGLNIEFNPITNYTFSNTGLGSFETGTNYLNGTGAPGDSLANGLNVAIASGTASVTGATLIDNAFITVASGAVFTDAGTLSGTGSLAVAGRATLTGNTSLASITDTGTLVLGGTVSGPVTVTGAASVIGTLVESGALSGTGTLTIGSGAAATLTGGSSVTTITDTGSLTVAGAVSSSITAAGTLAVATGTSATLSGNDTVTGVLADAGTLTISGSLTDAAAITGTGSLIVTGTAALTGNTSLTGGITDTGTLTLGGTDAVAVSIASGAQAIIGSNFSDTSAITGAGNLTINAGITAGLASGSSIGSVADFGTINLAGGMGGSINMEGNGAHSVVDFNTSNDIVALTSFGTTDDVILSYGSFAAVPATANIGLSYNTGSGVLTVTETNGTTIVTDTITISGTAAGALSTSSFVALESAKGLNIELAPTTATGYAFSVATTGAFETPANFTGGTAPGDLLSANESVTIAAGTASVASSGITDNGAITVNSGTGFIDAGSLSGAGSLIVSGTASLTGNTTLGGGITDNGTLTLGGTDAVAVSIATGAQAIIAGNFSDTSAITGPGSLTVNTGITASLAAGSSIGSVADFGTIKLAGGMGGSINMEGNGAHSVVDFNAANAAVTLTNFGTTDDVILTAPALATPPASSNIGLSYNNGVLTVTETNGTTITTDNITISGTTTGVGGLSTGSFIALESAAGINIELAPTTATSYVFSSSSTGAFETSTNFTGGTAPGDLLAPLESVTIAAGTATVASSGITDNGAITVNSGTGFIDAGSLSGTGSLVVSGTASLTGNTSLTGGITDNGSLALGGTVSGPVTINGSASVAGTLIDTGSLTGTGALAITGNATLTGGASGVSITDSGSLTVAGSVSSNISGAGTLAVAANTSATLSGTDSIGKLADAGTLTVSGSFTDTGAVTGTGSLNVTGTAALTGSTTLGGGITDSGTLILGGADAVAISLASTGQATIASNFSDSAAITGTGTITVNTGVTATLGSVSAAAILNHGTINLTGSAVSAINMEGDNAHSAVEISSGTNVPVLTNFGTTDEIILNGLQVPAGDALVLSYSNGVLTGTETSASGSVSLGSISVSGVAGDAALSSGSFIELQSAAGVVIELAPAATAATSFTFNGTGAFENYADYTGGIAPGDYIPANESVTIASGTASVSTGGITDNGTIAVNSGAAFIDGASLSGTGTLVVGGSATLTDGGSLGSIIDNGTLTLAGSFSAPITAGAGAQVTLSGNFADSAPITGAGTLTVGSGVTATLAAGTSLGSILDHGTIDVSGGVTSPIDMIGNGAGSVVDFTGPTSTTPLINFGTGDDIIIGGSALPAPGAGDGLVLSYNSGVLTVTETDSSGHSLSSDNITVSGTASNNLSAGSFIALETAKGLDIELAPTTSTTYDFSVTSTGSFENYTNYVGGAAPGDTLTSNMTVAVIAGTASVTNSGVTDNGLISVASGTGFIDAGSLTGSGTLAIASGGSATLTGATTLASITDAGALTLSGSDAVAISLASGAQVVLSGNFADSQAITGAGTLTVDAGFTATLASGSSIASVLDAGTLDLAGSFGGVVDLHGNGAGTVVDFTGANVSNHTLATGIINLGYGDEIVLGTANFALNSSSDVLTKSYDSTNGILTVTDVTNHSTVTIDVGLTAGDLASNLHASDASGQLEITLCFYPGTALATATGEIKVEDLQKGDMLMTSNGAMPVRWIGQSHIHTGFADPLRSLPIRIRQGALGDGLPLRDLLLSPDHAIAIDGILVQASALVNGSSIIREYDVPEQFSYYHVELDSHELLFAEGVEAESFVDNVDRMHFHNWDDRVAPAAPITEMDLPRAKATRQVPQTICRRLGLSKVAVA